MKKVQFILISSILALGLIISSAFLSIAVDRASKSENEITVKGVAEKRIKADRAVMNVILTAKNKERDLAEKDILEKQAAVTDILKNSELKEENYNIGNLRIKPYFSEDSNKILSYEITQTVTVSMRDVEQIDGIYEKLLELKLKFNNLEVIKPEYHITNIEKYKKDLLVEASRNAQNRAYEMLKANRSSVGELKNLNQGQFELINDMEDTKRVSEDEVNQMYKIMRSVVTVTYAIDDNKK